MRIKAVRLGHYPDQDQSVFVNLPHDATTDEIWIRAKAAMETRWGHRNVDCWQEVTAHIPVHMRTWALAQ